MILVIKTLVYSKIIKNIEYVIPPTIKVDQHINKILINEKNEIKYNWGIHDIFSKIYKNKLFCNRFIIASQKKLNKKLQNKGIENENIDAVIDIKISDILVNNQIIKGELSPIIFDDTRYWSNSHILENGEITFYSFYLDISYDIQLTMLDIREKKNIYLKKINVFHQFEILNEELFPIFVIPTKKDAKPLHSIPDIKLLIYNDSDTLIDNFLKTILPDKITETIKFNYIPQYEKNNLLMKLLNQKKIDDIIAILLNDINKINNKKPKEIIFYNLANLYELHKNYESSIDYYKKAYYENPQKKYLRKIEILTHINQYTNSSL